MSVLTVPRATPRLTLVSASLLVGAGLGAVILWAEHVLGYTWIGFVGSASPWVVVAFAIGYLAGRSISGALYGAVTLLVGLMTFYAADAIVNGAAVSTLWSSTAVFWYVAGLLAGPLAGLAGAWAAGTATRLRLIAGWAFPVALVWAEGLSLAAARGVRHAPSSAYLFLLAGLAVLSLSRWHLRSNPRVVLAIAAVAIVAAVCASPLYSAVWIRGLL